MTARLVVLVLLFLLTGCRHRSDVMVWVLQSPTMGRLWMDFAVWPGIIEPQTPSLAHAAELARVQAMPQRPYAWDLTLELW
jgi:hypothetical protein